MRNSVAVVLSLLFAAGTVSAQQYLITTVAGGGTVGYSGDGGPATSAQIYPSAVAVDHSGNLYIADGSNCVIRKVAAATGVITTVAGNGTCGYSGDGGPATSAQLSGPEGVAVDGAGNLYIADSDFTGYNYMGWLRKVEAAAGTITTVTKIGSGGVSLRPYYYDVTVDGSGDLYVCDGYDAAILKVEAATGATTIVASGLADPMGVAVDASGNLYIADNQEDSSGPPPIFYDIGMVLKVAAGTGRMTTVAGNGVRGYSGDGGPATSAEFGTLCCVAVDGSGNVYIADGGNSRLRQVSAATGIVTTVAGNGTAGYSGDGGPATSAQLYDPGAVALDAAGDIYFADDGRIRMLVPAGTRALLSIAGTHSGSFTRGQTETYSVLVSNAVWAGPTNGAVTVTETAPAGLTLVSMSGEGWNCSGAACTRSDVLHGGASYSPITVAVNVTADALPQVTNVVSVSGGGATTASVEDLTTIASPPPAVPVLVSPANGAIIGAATLAWTVSAGATYYDVYFGDLSTPPLVTTTTGTTYAVNFQDTGPGTTYYWQIVAQNGSGSAASETWSFTAALPPTGTRFVPVTPCRVEDTRNSADGPMTAGSTRSWYVSYSCNFPVTGNAYALNVTVVPDGPLGYLTLWPTGESRPGVSTLNSWGGIPVANAAIVAQGTGLPGDVSVYVSNQTDVILDVNGYFSALPGLGSYFYTVQPCRVADTRGSAGLFGGPSLYGGETRDFPIPSGPCGIPATATAYSLNVTAVPGTDYLGYLTTWPTGRARPNVSTLNSWTGKVVANAALIPAGSNGSVSVYVTDATDVILDINGYFGQQPTRNPGPPPDASALSFYPVVPCRMVDTRGAAGPFGGPEMEAQSTRSFTLPAGGCPVPATAQAYSLNVTVVPDGPLSFLTAWPAGSPQPFVSTLNSFDGSVVANAAIVPAGTGGAVSIYVTDRTQVILDINGYFAP